MTMELSGSRTIMADKATVWQHLNDPETLRASIPGCQELSGSPEAGFEATVKQKVGPVTATFRGKVMLEDVVEAESYRIVGEGAGGVAGFAKGAAQVHLRETPEGTILDYEVEAMLGGKIAQLGSRIVGGFARKTADAFFENFQTVVEGRTNKA